MRYFDAHVHVRLRDEDGAAALAAQLDERGIGLFHCGLDPREWADDERRLGPLGRVWVGAGLHPWWVQGSARALGHASCGIAEAELLERICAQTRLIGEVGLDFGRKTSEEGRCLQLACFERVCAAAAAAARETGEPRVLSIHCVRAAGTVLDVLGRTGALADCRCVFHWFSGSSDELWRAIRAGCWFSMNSMGLGTGKGREYARLVPADRLLTETDLESTFDVPEEMDALERALSSAVELMAGARGADVEGLRAMVTRNARDLLS